MNPISSSLEFWGIFMITAFAIAVFLLPYIFYLVTLQNTLKSIAPQNREMQPGQVWLMLIPLFNIVWQFILIDRLSNSIKKELRMRSIPGEERPTYNIGLAYCILFVTGWVPLLGTLGSLAGIVCWIIHWVQVSEYRNRFRVPFSGDGESDIFNVYNR